ncbi:MAG TPA: hypothetical protein VFI65_13695 [Streptosporangiaceae bacterium]|nr:hypothetical protein [Streptosporangiaceae bacterium]
MPHIDHAEAAAGLALLQLQAKASDPMSQPSWVKRRVEKLEFLDTRAVRWEISVDFEVPESAPAIHRGGERFHLVPIHSLTKASLIAFDLRDEKSATVWLPTSRENTQLLQAALVYWASENLGIEAPDLPEQLVTDLGRIISSPLSELRADPPALLLASNLIIARRRTRLAKRQHEQAQRLLGHTRIWHLRRRIDLRLHARRARRDHSFAVRAEQRARQRWDDLGEKIGLAAFRLMASAYFRRMIEDLSKNFIIYICVRTPPQRRIIKLAYEGQVRFRRPRGRFQRIWQSLGWRPWQVDLRIGAKGGSHHLEVTAPPGVDIVGITADPAWTEGQDEIGRSHRWRSLWARLRGIVVWSPDAAVAIPGYLPHVQVIPPNAAYVRYRTAIFVRVSRTGWLTASWLVAVVIGGVMIAGRFNLDALYDKHASGEAGTAATLLLALLGVFATMLVGPMAHPLASRLLLLARLLIGVDVIVILVGVGDLVLHQAGHPTPVRLWTVLAVLATVVMGLMTISRVFPIARPPHRE